MGGSLGQEELWETHEGQWFQAYHWELSRDQWGKAEHWKPDRFVGLGRAMETGWGQQSCAGLAGGHWCWAEC